MIGDYHWCSSYSDATAWSSGFFHQDFLLCTLFQCYHCFCACCNTCTWNLSQLRRSGCVFGKKEWDSHSFIDFSHSLQKRNMNGKHGNTREIRRKVKGVQVEGVGAPQWFTHRNIVVYLPWLQQAKVWSVALVADGRELILIIQTDGPDCELVLWDHITLLGSTVLRVTFQNKRKMRPLKTSHSLAYTHSFILSLFWKGFRPSRDYGTLMKKNISASFELSYLKHFYYEIKN